MRILITNDDGFRAPGIQALAKALRKVADVTIIAPASDQSGRGHSITMHEPIRFRKERENGEVIGYSVTGTPADCVKIGIHHILEEQPDAVFSGINHGRNTGMNVLYSGTVAGAMEAAMYNIPAAAISLATISRRADFTVAAEFSAALVPVLMKLDLPHSVMLNVNVPECSADEIAGVDLGKQSEYRFIDMFEEREDPRGGRYFWLSGERMTLKEKGAVDEVLITENKIAITPIRGDRTDYDWMRKLQDVDLAAMLQPE